MTTITQQSTRVSIPEGLKLQRPAVQYQDEVLFLASENPDLYDGRTFRVLDCSWGLPGRAEATDGGTSPRGYDVWRDYTGSDVKHSWPPEGAPTSWAIVNGPAEKGDWVIVLEWAFPFFSPDEKAATNLWQVEVNYDENDLVVEKGYVARRWAKVELDAPYKPGDRVEVVGWDSSSPYWDGPATVVKWSRGANWVHVKSDKNGAVGAFEPEYVRPLNYKIGDRVEIFGYEFKPEIWNGPATVTAVHEDGLTVRLDKAIAADEPIDGGFYPWKHVRALLKEEPQEPTYKRGDRVEVFGSDYAMVGLVGPGRITRYVDWSKSWVVEFDHREGELGFPEKNVRPLQEESVIPTEQPKPKLADLNLGAVIKDKRDGGLYVATKSFSSPHHHWYRIDKISTGTVLVDDFEVLFPGVDSDE